MTPPATDKILILDFGSQVTQLIARRVRESGVYCEIHPFAMDEAKLKAFGAKAVILSGGPASVHVAESPRAPQTVFELGVPVLGICYGEQTMCAQLGGRVSPSDHREFGRAFLEITGDCALFHGLWKKGAREQVWMSHGDRVDQLPPRFKVVGVSDGAPFAAIADDKRRFYGVQFHPEVVHTPHGAALLKNFKVTESVRAQLRFEALNADNHPNFDGIDSNLNSGTFGKAQILIGNAISRRLQLGARVTF